jgi:hypothetical protein
MTYPGYNGQALETIVRAYGNLGASLLDWCYSEIPQNMRIALSQALYKLNRKFVTALILTSAGNSYVSSHNAFNCVLTTQNIISLYGNEGINIFQQDTLDTWYRIIYDKWINGFFPCYGYYRGITGGWNWGAAYSFWGLTDQYLLFDIFLNGTNKNFYQDMPWILNSINQYWYMIRPDYVCIHQGDGETFVVGDNVVFRHAAVFNDPRSQWLSQYFTTAPFLSSTYTYFSILKYKDFNGTVVPKPSPPLNWFSDKVGLVTSNTSWDSTAIQFWFFNSWSKKASHEHRDNNTFSIYYKKPLIVDAGFYDSYGSTHFKNYYTRTVAHNTINIYDPGEIMYYGTEVVANDGGQIYSDAMQNYSNIFAPQFQRGRWFTYSQDTNFVYCSTDATLSYISTKQQKVFRKIFYHKPDKIIICDYIVLKDSLSPLLQKEVRFTLHFWNQPQINGQIIESQVPGHIETFNGKNYIAVNGQGRVIVNTLHPDSTKTRRIGGTNYEYWVNGVNFPTISNPDTIRGCPGRWRIEIIPKLESDTVLMLHNLYISDLNAPLPQTAIKLKSNITLGTDWYNSLYFFNSKGDTGSTTHAVYGITGNRQINIFAFDLCRNKNYNIIINNIIITNVQSDTSGILKKQVTLPPGNCNIVITTGIIGIYKISSEIPDEYKLHQNYPNPFNPTTKIKFDIPQKTVIARSGATWQSLMVSLKVYDILGKEIQTLANEQLQPGTYEVTFDGSNLPSGIYFYQLTSEKFSGTKKLILLK